MLRFIVFLNAFQGDIGLGPYQSDPPDNHFLHEVGAYL